MTVLFSIPGNVRAVKDIRIFRLVLFDKY